jgi:hypothetical protein
MKFVYKMYYKILYVKQFINIGNNWSKDEPVKK